MALGEDAAIRTKDFVKAPYRFVRLAGHAHWLPNEGEPDLQPIILAHLRAYDGIAANLSATVDLK